jgi:hypothetical protein
VSVDRVAVPMEEPLDASHDTPPKDLEAFRDAARRHLKPQVSEHAQAVIEEATRTAAESKRKVNRNYRMAYCGTVTLAARREGSCTPHDSIRAHAASAGQPRASYTS